MLFSCLFSPYFFLYCFMFSQLPFLCGLPFLERRASQTAHWIVGRTGKHLFLTDNDEGQPPLLLQMVNDSEDLKFMWELEFVIILLQNWCSKFLYVAIQIHASYVIMPSADQLYVLSSAVLPMPMQTLTVSYFISQ